MLLRLVREQAGERVRELAKGQVREWATGQLREQVREQVKRWATKSASRPPRADPGLSTYLTTRNFLTSFPSCRK